MGTSYSSGGLTYSFGTLTILWLIKITIMFFIKYFFQFFYKECKGLKRTAIIIRNIIGIRIIIIHSTILIIILQSFCIQYIMYSNIDTIVYGSIYDSKYPSINASIYSIIYSSLSSQETDFYRVSLFANFT